MPKDARLACSNSKSEVLASSADATVEIQNQPLAQYRQCFDAGNAAKAL
jgi:hypothetical protein